MKRIAISFRGHKSHCWGLRNVLHTFVSGKRLPQTSINCARNYGLARTILVSACREFQKSARNSSIGTKVSSCVGPPPNSVKLSQAAMRSCSGGALASHSPQWRRIFSITSCCSSLPATRSKGELTFDQLNQWQLMALRFRRHKLAVGALFILIALYLAALTAEFVAPQHKMRRNLAYAYSPPHAIGFSFKHGFYAKGMRQDTDPETLRKRYTPDPTLDAPLGVFVRGDTYKFWGLIEWDRHLIGINYNRLDIPEGMTRDDYGFHFLEGFR